MDLSFKCVNATVLPRSGYQIDIEADDVDVDDIAEDVIDNMSASEIVKFYNDDGSLLKAIGIDACKEYFDLKEIDED